MLGGATDDDVERAPVRDREQDHSKRRSRTGGGRQPNRTALAEDDHETELKLEIPPLKRELPKVGRNDPCPCGSKKKFKSCCGRESA